MSQFLPSKGMWFRSNHNILLSLCRQLRLPCLHLVDNLECWGNCEVQLLVPPEAIFTADYALAATASSEPLPSAASMPVSAPGQKTPAEEPVSGTYCGLACLVSTQVALEYSCHALQLYNEQLPLQDSRVWSVSTFKIGTALAIPWSFFISHPRQRL